MILSTAGTLTPAIRTQQAESPVVVVNHIMNQADGRMHLSLKPRNTVNQEDAPMQDGVTLYFFSGCG